MWATAKKVWPSQAMTTAFTLSSASASAIAWTSPCRTAVLSAFTGGLFERTISTSPCLRVEIGLVAGLSKTSVIRGTFEVADRQCARPTAAAGQGLTKLPLFRHGHGRR